MEGKAKRAEKEADKAVQDSKTDVRMNKAHVQMLKLKTAEKIQKVKAESLKRQKEQEGKMSGKTGEDLEKVKAKLQLDFEENERRTKDAAAEKKRKSFESKTKLYLAENTKRAASAVELENKKGQSAEAVLLAKLREKDAEMKALTADTTVMHTTSSVEIPKRRLVLRWSG
jgi:hypothetical protein